ncbi:hypothetical protein Tco_0101404, partial [Tanacetum coccineum]
IRSACPRLNQAQRPGGNPQNQVVAINRGHGRGNQGNQARGRAFILGIEPADLGFSYEIEIDSGQLVEIDKVESGQRPRVNHQNQVVAVNGGHGRGNQGNQARGRAFMLGGEEAC